MGKGRRQGKDMMIFPFHYFVSGALAAGTNYLLVAPNGNMTPRGVVEADAWQHYRMVRLSFRLHPNGTRTSAQAAGYIGGQPDTIPSTLGQIAELLPSTFLGLSTTVPTEWVNIPKLDLAGPIPWYKTIPGGADPTEESPGILAVAGTGTEVYMLEMRGVIEFKTSSATANTPLALNCRRQLREERLITALQRERNLLLKILGTAVGPPQVLLTLPGAGQGIPNIQTGQ